VTVRASGKVNLIGVVIVGAVAYGGWWLFTYAPAKLDHLDVKEAIIAGYNQAKTDNLGNVRLTIMNKLNGKDFGWHYEIDEANHRVRKPGLGIKDEQLIIEKNDVTDSITVTVEYDRTIELKPFDKEETKHFYFSKVGPIR
jgi:hypothetical protein